MIGSQPQATTNHPTTDERPGGRRRGIDHLDQRAGRCTVVLPRPEALTIVTVAPAPA
jgi:hypothetical protein